MMMLRLGVLACAALLAAQPAGARPTVSEDYVGTFDPLTFGRCADDTIPVNLGMVCFDVNHAVDNFVDISGTDVVFGPAGMFYAMVDSSGTCVGQPDDPTQVCPNADFACGESLNVTIPNGAVRLEVYALGVLGVVDCTLLEPSEALGAASTGTISAHFTQSA